MRSLQELWGGNRNSHFHNSDAITGTGRELGIFNGLVVPFGTSGMVQVDRPLVLVPLVPRKSEDPLLLVPLVPLLSEDPLLLIPLVPHTPTCPNLSHLVVPLVLSQLSFLRFFLGFFLSFHFQVSKNTYE